jgi:hypothetical protein
MLGLDIFESTRTSWDNSQIIDDKLKVCLLVLISDLTFGFLFFGDLEDRLEIVTISDSDDHHRHQIHKTWGNHQSADDNFKSKMARVRVSPI